MNLGKISKLPDETSLDIMYQANNSEPSLRLSFNVNE